MEQEMEQEGQIKKMEHVFVFPPEADDIKFLTAGTVVIDYYTGEVGLSGGCSVPKGRLPKLQKNLKGVHRSSIRSIILRVDKKVRIYTDEDNRQLIPVEAGDLWRLEMLPFQKLYIKILSTNTTLMTCMASTSLVGFVPTMKGAATALGSGQKSVTTAGTRVQLSSTSVPCHSVNIHADKDNTNNIYVGGSNVSSSNGRKLRPDASISMNIKDLDAIWLDADTGGNSVDYAYVYG